MLHLLIAETAFQPNLDHRPHIRVGNGQDLTVLFQRVCIWNRGVVFGSWRHDGPIDLAESEKASQPLVLVAHRPLTQPPGSKRPVELEHMIAVYLIGIGQARHCNELRCHVPVHLSRLHCASLLSILLKLQGSFPKVKSSWLLDNLYPSFHC